MTTIHDYQKIFNLVFTKPELTSERGYDLWFDLEIIIDALAGPYYSILKNGNCNYVYTDKKTFPSIYDTNSFRNWSLKLIEEYKNIVSNFTPENQAENDDKNSFSKVLESMYLLINTAEILTKN